MANVDLDCRELSCPMPIVKISRAIKTLAVNDTLTVLASDPSFAPDIEAWVRRTGQRLQSLESKDATQTAVIVKVN